MDIFFHPWASFLKSASELLVAPNWRHIGDTWFVFTSYGPCLLSLNALFLDLFSFTVRSNLIPCPPTYNSKYGYLSWESYYNLSYYTRLLPPVPGDCPTPLGVKGWAALHQHACVNRREMLILHFSCLNIQEKDLDM